MQTRGGPWSLAGICNSILRHNACFERGLRAASTREGPSTSPVDTPTHHERCHCGQEGHSCNGIRPKVARTKIGRLAAGLGPVGGDGGAPRSPSLDRTRARSRRERVIPGQGDVSICSNVATPARWGPGQTPGQGGGGLERKAPPAAASPCPEGAGEIHGILETLLVAQEVILEPQRGKRTAPWTGTPATGGLHGWQGGESEQCKGLWARETVETKT